MSPWDLIVMTLCLDKGNLKFGVESMLHSGSNPNRNTDHTLYNSILSHVASSKSNLPVVINYPLNHHQMYLGFDSLLTLSE